MKQLIPDRAKYSSNSSRCARLENGARRVHGKVHLSFSQEWPMAKAAMLAADGIRPRGSGMNLPAILTISQMGNGFQRLQRTFRPEPKMQFSQEFSISMDEFCSIGIVVDRSCGLTAEDGMNPAENPSRKPVCAFVSCVLVSWSTISNGRTAMLSTLNDRLASLFSDPFEAVFRESGRDFHENGRRRDGSKSPELSIWEDDRRLYVQLDVPGVSRDDIDVTMEKGQLWIRGERKLPHLRENMYYDERRYGRFERFVSFTEAVDPNSIDAALADGVLTITLSKKPEHQPRKVAINYGEHAKKLSDSRSKK